MKTLNPAIRDWRGQRVWVIGASSGIGKALVLDLRARGARLALSARRETVLQELAESGELVIPMDVADADSVSRGLQQIRLDWEAVDLVVYCVGIYEPMSAIDFNADSASRIMDVNLLGIYRLLPGLIAWMRANGQGGICLIGSVAGYAGLPKALAYGPSKAALINLAEILYVELSKLGFAVYLVNPGFVDTRLTRKNRFRMPARISPDQAADYILAGLARGRFEIHFPVRFTLWLKLLRMLPARTRFWLLKKAND